jgi:hypothetical protein
MTAAVWCGTSPSVRSILICMSADGASCGRRSRNNTYMPSELGLAENLLADA